MIYATMKPKPIISQEFEVGFDTYIITVRSYDAKAGHVTADWFRMSDRQEGCLGYGVSSCDSAIDLAERAILSGRQH